MKRTYHRPQVIQILKELHVLASFVGGVFPLPPFLEEMGYFAMKPQMVSH
jgi:hypothetical protein